MELISYLKRKLINYGVKVAGGGLEIFLYENFGCMSLSLRDRLADREIM